MFILESASLIRVNTFAYSVRRSIKQSPRSPDKANFTKSNKPIEPMFFPNKAYPREYHSKNFKCPNMNFFLVFIVKHFLSENSVKKIEEKNISTPVIA